MKKGTTERVKEDDEKGTENEMINRTGVAAGDESTGR